MNRRPGYNGDMLWIAGTVLLTVTVYAVCWRAASYLLSPPMSPMIHFPEHYDLPYENISFSTRDGLTLKGWFLPSSGARNTPRACSISSRGIYRRDVMIMKPPATAVFAAMLLFAIPDSALGTRVTAAVKPALGPVLRPMPLPIPHGLAPVLLPGIAVAPALTPIQAAVLPKGFIPIPAKPVNLESFHRSGIYALHSKGSSRKILEYARLNPALWDGAIPDHVYSNAVEDPGTPLVRPLREEVKGRPAFLHGTSREAASAILRKGPLLAPGWGAVDAGFFLDRTGGLVARGWANKKEDGVLLQVYLDPNAPTFTMGSALTQQFLEWLQRATREDPKALRLLKKLHPRFMKLAGPRPDRVSRDNLARSLGAKILINQTLYGQTLIQDIVVLDPSAVLGARVLKPAGD